eukprot:scaffold122779_cov63-Phaeocystis_antarctica.AAC.3
MVNESLAKRPAAVSVAWSQMHTCVCACARVHVCVHACICVCVRRGCGRTDFELFAWIGGSEAASSVAEMRSAACEWLCASAFSPISKHSRAAAACRLSKLAIARRNCASVAVAGGLAAAAANAAAASASRSMPGSGEGATSPPNSDTGGVAAFGSLGCVTVPSNSSRSAAVAAEPISCITCSRCAAPKRAPPRAAAEMPAVLMTLCHASSRRDEGGLVRLPMASSSASCCIVRATAADAVVATRVVGARAREIPIGRHRDRHSAHLGATRAGVAQRRLDRLCPSRVRVAHEDADGHMAHAEDLAARLLAELQGEAELLVWPRLQQLHHALVGRGRMPREDLLVAVEEEVEVEMEVGGRRVEDEEWWAE